MFFADHNISIRRRPFLRVRGRGAPEGQSRKLVPRSCGRPFTLGTFTGFVFIHHGDDILILNSASSTRSSSETHALCTSCRCSVFWFQIFKSSCFGFGM